MAIGTSTPTINVVLVDDHPLARQGVKNLLRCDAAIKVLGEASSEQEAIDLINRLRPQVVLLDIRLNKGSGIQVATSVMASAPDTRILVLTAYDSEQYVYALARLGVCGYLLKTASGQELRRAIHDAASGRLVFGPGVSEKVKRVLAGDPGGELSSGQASGILTGKELEVLRHVREGMRNTDIAAAMEISVRTVETHMEHILLKLDVRSRTQAVVLAAEHGWL